MTPMLIILMLLVGVAQVPATPQAPRTAGTGVIRGRVTDAETGQPMSRAPVRLSMARGEVRRENLTDAEGRFEFRNLPAGEIDLSAGAGDHRASHLRGHFRRGPRMPSLAEGEVLEGADIVLRRALSISGRVVNDAGEPLARLDIRLRRTEGGAYGDYGSSRSTDDRGMFRLFGIEPGRYVVCAEFLRGERFPGVQSRTRVQRYVTTCHPDAVSPADAQVITVDAEDVSGIDVVMRRTLTYSISGTAIDSNGQPIQFGMVELITHRENGSSSGGNALRDGRFTLIDLAPGRYTVAAQVGGPQQPLEGRDLERAEVDVELTNGDIDNVSLVTRKAARIVGRVRFEGGAVPELRPGGPQPMSVEIRRDVNGRGPLFGRPPPHVGMDLTFELRELFGPVRLALVNAPRGWVPQALLYKGKDILDVHVVFAAGDNEVEFVLTDRGAMISGTVTAEAGRAASGVRVLVFPVDPAKWHEQQLFYGTARTSAKGTFSFGPVLAGDYYVVAVEGDRVPLTPRPGELLHRLTKVAERITLLEADRRTVDLRVASLPDDRRAP